MECSMQFTWQYPAMLHLDETEKVIQNSEDSFCGKPCKHVICSPTNKQNILNWKQGWEKKMCKTQIWACYTLHNFYFHFLWQSKK